MCDCFPYTREAAGAFPSTPLASLKAVDAAAGAGPGRGHLDPRVVLKEKLTFHTAGLAHAVNHVLYDIGAGFVLGSVQRLCNSSLRWKCVIIQERSVTCLQMSGERQIPSALMQDEVLSSWMQECPVLCGGEGGLAEEGVWQ